MIFSSCSSRPEGDFSAAVTRRREIVRTPFLVFGAALCVTGVTGAEVWIGSATWRTALSAGVFARKSSSAPGKLALRVIGRLLGQLVHGQDGGMTAHHLMKMHKQ